MEELSKFFANATVAGIIKATVIMVAGLLTIRVLSRIVEKSLTERFDRHTASIAKKIITYLLLLAILMVVLSTFGIKLTALLAAAGLFTVAIGFAAQTSISNIISGFFLLLERPFEVDDIVEVEGTAGIVLSMDMMSTKIRTFDNLFVRIPNEAILKATVKTISKYAIRRIDVDFGIAYNEKISHAKEVVTAFLKSHPLVLEDPEPLVFTLSMGDSAVNLRARVWINRNNYISGIDQITHGIKDTLDEANIEIPYPHLTLYFGEKPEFAISGNGGRLEETEHL
jgi:small-conductance mechanosensitive channel